MATRRLSGMTTSASVPDNGGDHSGGGGSGGGYVDGVFSTYVYEGTQTVTDIKNGIDLAGEDGMVWLKGRTTTKYHRLIRNDGGTLKSLSSNSTDAENSNSYITSFNSDGFTISGGSQTNESGQDYTSWTFRKAPKFFDVVTWTGDGVAGREIPHNLGVEPGMIIVKNITNGASDWRVYHRSLGATKNLLLNGANAALTQTGMWNDTEPTSTVFTVGDDGGTNGNAAAYDYVAYVFAHDDTDESMIKCGSYTGNGSTDGPEIDLGFEPQWLLFKSSTKPDAWTIFDVARGITTGGGDPYLMPHNSGEEIAGQQCVDLMPTGFKIANRNNFLNGSGEDYIYMAIRKPNNPIA